MKKNTSLINRIRELLKLEHSSPIQSMLPEKPEVRAMVWKLPNGKIHREFGPAVVFEDGYESWFLNGKRHRIGGPAIVHPSGQKSYWVEGKRHRDDGPAVERPEGDHQYYLEGNEVSREEFLRLRNITE